MGRRIYHKSCRCHTCERDFHYLGINRHVAMHRDRKEDCEVTFTYGDRYKYNFAEKPIDEEAKP